MKPKNIFLIRHGESEGNVHPGVYNETPDWTVPLTEKGKEQAEEMANNVSRTIKGNSTDIPIYDLATRDIFGTYVYCSPWYRARQTAEPLQRTLKVLKYYEDPRLREQEWGNFREEDLALKIERERYKYGSFFYRMPYGESGADVYDRVSTFLETLYRDFKKPSFPHNAIIVTHGLTIRIFLMRWFHWSVEDFEAYKTPRNCDIIHMRMNQESGRYQLKTPLRKRPK